MLYTAYNGTANGIIIIINRTCGFLFHYSPKHRKLDSCCATDDSIIPLDRWATVIISSVTRIDYIYRCCVTKAILKKSKKIIKSSFVHFNVRAYNMMRTNDINHIILWYLPNTQRDDWCNCIFAFRAQQRFLQWCIFFCRQLFVQKKRSSKSVTFLKRLRRYFDF